MKQTLKTQILIWAITLITAARLTYTAIQHHMAILDIAAIALASTYAFNSAMNHIAAAVRRTQAGADR